MSIRFLIYAAILATTPSPASSVFAADAVTGLRLAERWCEACHVIKPDQLRAMADAPTFRSVAEKYSEIGTLAAFLSAPYPRMPSMALTRDEIADLVAYIRTLGPKRIDPPPPPEKDRPPETPGRG